MINNKIIVFSASRLVKKNGLKYLIKAMKLLPENFICFIAGSGKLENKLKKQILKNNLQKRVFLLGQLERKKVDEWYKITDIFCRPSLSEGFGNVFIEAISFGAPCVAPNIQGITDIFNDFPTLMFDCGVKKPKIIAEKIIEAAQKLIWKKSVDNGKIFIGNY